MANERFNIEKLIEYILLIRQKYPEFQQALVFGSYAKGHPHDNSDIDLALIFNELKESDRFNFQVQLMLLAANIDSRIEPHPLSIEDFNSGNPMAAEIRKTGIEVDAEL
jgi:uncharacterized protein